MRIHVCMRMRMLEVSSWATGTPSLHHKNLHQTQIGCTARLPAKALLHTDSSGAQHYCWSPLIESHTGSCWNFMLHMFSQTLGIWIPKVTHVAFPRGTAGCPMNHNMSIWIFAHWSVESLALPCKWSLHDDIAHPPGRQEACQVAPGRWSRRGTKAPSGSKHTYDIISALHSTVRYCTAVQ